MPPNRDKTSKFYIPEEMYSDVLLPPYVSGGGYLFSGHLIPTLLNASYKHTTIPNEDANFGILMHFIGVFPIENPNMLPYIYCNESLWKRPSCDFLYPFVIHDIKNYAQIWMHYHVKVLSKIKGICVQSHKYRQKNLPPMYCPTDNSS